MTIQEMKTFAWDIISRFHSAEDMEQQRECARELGNKMKSITKEERYLMDDIMVLYDLYKSGKRTLEQCESEMKQLEESNSANDLS